MLTVEKLEKFGADAKQGLSRCADNEALYLRLVGITVQELSSGALGEALEAGDLEKAYYIAHKLKGGVNNLSLTPIAVPLCELTELLRNQTPGDYKALYAEIIRQTNALAAL
ncbi:MAG: Hpt domain-containing protein [Oscillospiraceae bacterium]|jgi:HPt (histidine-containing phosphotransfer) domain-containing protein|nr:Hpt domain-containing protein [Oscillospiraceae bacterium]